MNQDNTKAVGVALQIPRNSLALLMVVQVVVTLPLAVYISPWIVAVCLFCGFWRTQVYRGRWGYPAGWVKFLLIVGACVGIGFSGYGAFTLEAATSLLVLAFALKLVEMRSRRDAYVVIFLGYFLVATAFLFDQTMTLAAYEMLAVVVVTAAMVGMNQLQLRIRPLASFWTALGLVLQALPLTVLMFLVFPRITTTLWSIPVPNATSTGLSEHLTPGDVASLTQSDELAFRAVFDGRVPAQRDLYWRGLVYSSFESGTWMLADPLPPLARPNVTVGEAGMTSYQVFMQPTQNNWLFALDTPVVYDARASLLADYRLQSREPVLSLMRYRVSSDPAYPMDANLSLSPEIEIRETGLPPGDNPRLRGYARQLLERTGSTSAMIEAMLEEIRRENYVYTLNPPRLPPTHSIDEFWFETRRGFCAHYAGAMVFALRSVGVPARLVGGYQGGEVNPVTGHVVVRQYDAHAWVEAWLPGRGWSRYDPTSAVAPQRVEQGLDAALSQEDRATLSFLSSARMDEDSMAKRLLQWADSLEHRWNMWVVGYDSATQSDVLKRLLGEITTARVAAALLIGGGLSLGLVAISLFWRRRPQQRHPVERLFQRFCRTMGRQGLGRGPQETPSAYIGRIAALARVDATALISYLQQQLYDPASRYTVRDSQWLRQEFRKLRFRLAFSTSGAAS